VPYRLANLHALPKRHPAFDIGSSVFGLGVVPGGVRVDVAMDVDGVVAGLALPGATGLVVAKADVFTLERGLGEVVVAFDHDGVVALGDDGVFPNGFHEFTP